MASRGPSADPGREIPAAPRSLPLQRERIDTPDGDFLDLDFGPDPNPEAPLVLLLHGLEGFTQRPYMIQAAQALTAQGLATVGLNFRSCSGEPNLQPRLYHSGETDDVSPCPRVSEGAVAGPAPGGHRVLPGWKRSSEVWGNGKTEVRGLLKQQWAFRSLTIWPPEPVYLEQGWAGFYARYFLRQLKEKVKAKEGLLAPILDLEKVYASQTLREFDDHATGPLHGFKDAADYYRKSSCGQFLPDIRVPTLLFHARNDPFLPPRSIPHEAVRENPFLFPAFARRGGHVGFLGGAVPGPPHLLDRGRGDPVPEGDAVVAENVVILGRSPRRSSTSRIQAKNGRRDCSPRPSLFSSETRHFQPATVLLSCKRPHSTPPCSFLMGPLKSDVEDPGSDDDGSHGAEQSGSAPCSPSGPQRGRR